MQGQPLLQHVEQGRQFLPRELCFAMACHASRKLDMLQNYTKIGRKSSMKFAEMGIWLVAGGLIHLANT